LQRVVKTAERIIGGHLPSVQGIYNSRCLRKARNIVKDHSHPGYGLFTLLPPGRRYRSIRARTNRLTNSYTEQSPSPCTSHPYKYTCYIYIYKHIFFILFNLIFPTLETALLVFETVVTCYMFYVICYFWYLLFWYMLFLLPVVCRLLRRCWLLSRKNFAALKKFGVCDNKHFDFDLTLDMSVPFPTPLCPTLLSCN